MYIYNCMAYGLRPPPPSILKKNKKKSLFCVFAIDSHNPDAKFTS